MVAWPHSGVRFETLAPSKEPIEEVLSLDEIKAGDQIVAIQFHCGKRAQAEAYKSIRVSEITRRRIYTNTQSKCANPQCREESGLNYWAGKGGDRVTKGQRRISL
jgi:hypothetical protein